jgi:hypothetical protein
MIVTRRRRLRGFGPDLDELAQVGLWTDDGGRRRRTELVRLGAHHGLAAALFAAELHLAAHPKGTAAHRWYADWHRRLKRTEWALVGCEQRYRALLAERCAGLPDRRPRDGGDDVPPTPPAAPGARPAPAPRAAA